MPVILENMLLSTAKQVSFDAQSSGWYLIKVSARVRSERQRGERETDDDELTVQIDAAAFPKLGTKSALLNSPAAFSGGELHNKGKIVYFIVQFTKGKHAITLTPQHRADVIEVSYERVSFSNNQLRLILNTQAEERDRNPWITFVLVSASLQSCTLEATVHWHWFDGDDIKVVVNDRIQRKIQTRFRKNWLFAARPVWDIFGRRQVKTLSLNLSKQPLHYVELVADKTPTIETVSFHVSDEVFSTVIQKYIDRAYGRDYNKLDEVIREVALYWNSFFFKQKYPLKEPLDPGLIKAIIYRESRLGYFPNKNIIDVMQVWDERNPAKDAILGKSPANELINDKKYGHMSYSYPKNKKLPKVTTREESVFWGARWLLHKAQDLVGTGENNLKPPYKRRWVSWKEAVRRYNGNPDLMEDYVSEVFSVYRDGKDAEGNVLWEKE